MTQRIWQTTLNGQAAEIMVGWDRPLQCHFTVIELAGHDDDTACYSNLDDPEAGIDESIFDGAGVASTA